ncbi:hypothetical protein [Chitinivibrio alkaliphilus]|uniref:hypothetical protein n=1 Tax=Chitinivibrio alkaliphilus TaxID=1505232 RepID=UPI000424147D|nr:hypothetical protein [Chitinivibrio alkaliphilus]
MVILDNVGNRVAQFSAGEIGPVENGMITFPFAPVNSAGRRLGRGAYSAQIDLRWSGPEGSTQRARRERMIGIKEDLFPTQ